MNNQSLLKQADAAIQNGERSKARLILDELVVEEPDNPMVWKLLFTVVENPMEKCDCLKNVVRINPGDRQAVQKLHKFKASAEYRQAKAMIVSEKRKQTSESKKRRQRRETLGKALSYIRNLVGW
jgi:hypothetical protein